MKFGFALADQSSGEISVSLKGGFATVSVDDTIEVDAAHHGSTIVFIPPTGFWTEVRQIDANGSDQQIAFQRLPTTGPLGWWHHVHGIHTSGLRGAGIRIGIIDEALPSRSNGSSIAHVVDLKDEGWQVADTNDRAVSPLTEHSVAVCSLLAARAASAACYEGMAPGAQVYFAAAGTDADEKLDASRIVGSLDLLSQKYDCHIVSVSAGGPMFDLPGLHQSIKRARKHGTLCLFAAGNSSRCDYPARYDECIAVAAVGKYGVAPEGTDVWAREHLESKPTDDSTLYLWANSAFGAEVDVAAVGVGPIWNHEDNAGRPACGTSYASPIAAGCLATVLGDDLAYLWLPPDASRVAHAEAILQRCRQLTVGGLHFSRHGLMTLL